MIITLLKMPDHTIDTYVRGFRCPACNSSAVCLASGNYLTCMDLECPNPDVADQIEKLKKLAQATEAGDE